MLCWTANRPYTTSEKTSFIPCSCAFAFERTNNHPGIQPSQAEQKRVRWESTNAPKTADRRKRRQTRAALPQVI
jgi:hypothetical protein